MQAACFPLKPILFGPSFCNYRSCRAKCLGPTGVGGRGARKVGREGAIFAFFSFLQRVQMAKTDGVRWAKELLFVAWAQRGCDNQAGYLRMR